MGTEEKKRDYKDCCRLVKQKVRESKERANESWGKRVTECFKENKKMFWKVVNKVRKVRHKLECRMKDDHGDVKSSEKEVGSGLLILEKLLVSRLWRSKVELSFKKPWDDFRSKA